MRPVRQLVCCLLPALLSYPSANSNPMQNSLQSVLACYVAAAFCWCLKVFGVLFSQRLAIEIKCLPGFVPYTGIGLAGVWCVPGLVGSVLIPRPQCKPIYALSRLADSLVRIHSSLILVSFACEARAGGERSLDCEWTCLGLFCFYDDDAVSAYSAHSLLLLGAQFSVVSSCQFTVPSSQFSVPSSLNVKQHKVIDG